MKNLATRKAGSDVHLQMRDSERRCDVTRESMPKDCFIT
jgi:hypothetical protein